MLKDITLPPIFDIQTVLRLEWDTKNSKFMLAPLKVNKAEPPRRKLDDIRSYIHIGPFGIALIFAHYRGKKPKPTFFLDRASA